LASAGFYYFPTEGKPDNVRCGDCGTDFFGWASEDDPVAIHKAESPDCPFVLENLMDENKPERKSPPKKRDDSADTHKMKKRKTEPVPVITPFISDKVDGGIHAVAESNFLNTKLGDSLGDSYVQLKQFANEIQSFGENLNNELERKLVAFILNCRNGVKGIPSSF
jgi:hypothetical protein